MDYINAPWLGTALGVLGIAFALYQIFRSRGPKLYYQFIGQNVIDSDNNTLPGGLKVTFEGGELTNLSLTQIIFWNGGSGTVRRSDLITTDPLTVEFSSTSKIVKAALEKVTRPAVDVSLTAASDDNIQVNFEFLDPQDGFLIKLWHTDKRTKPLISGTVVGIPSGPQDLGRIPPTYSRKRMRKLPTGDPFM